MRIHEYIYTINEISNHGGDLELSLAYELYHINIAEYKEIRDNNDKLISLNFVKYINDNNEENKDLLILTNINDNHFNLAYYNNTIVDTDFNPISNITNNYENNNNISNNNLTYLKKNNDNKKESMSIIDTYIYKDLSNLNLDEILEFYNYNTKVGEN